MVIFDTFKYPVQYDFIHAVQIFLQMRLSLPALMFLKVIWSLNAALTPIITELCVQYSIKKTAPFKKEMQSCSYKQVLRKYQISFLYGIFSGQHRPA